MEPECKPLMSGRGKGGGGEGDRRERGEETTHTVCYIFNDGTLASKHVSLTQRLECQRREQDEKDRNQILESHYSQVAKDTSNLGKRRVPSITQTGRCLDLTKNGI